MKIQVLSRFADEYRKFINLPEAVFSINEEDVKDFDFEVLFTDKVSNEFLGKAKNLRWVQFMWAGVNSIIANVPKDVILTRTVGAASKDISRYVLTYVMYYSENLPTRFENQKNRLWDDSECFRSFKGSVGIFGLGTIGKEIAKLLYNAGFEVNALARNSDKPEYISNLYSKEDLLKKSDFVILSLPETNDTRGFISSKELSMMKRDAVLINIGRGSAIDETGLVSALRKKEIKAAVLDVFQKEPLPKDHEFWQLDNIILTSHIAGHYNFGRRAELFIENFERYRQNKELLGTIDAKKGY